MPDSNDVPRNVEVEGLTAIGVEVFDRLGAHLSHPEANMRRFAARSLRRLLESAKVIVDSLAGSLTGPDDDVRYSVSLALKVFGPLDDRIFTVMTKALKNDHNDLIIYILGDMLSGYLDRDLSSMGDAKENLLSALDHPLQIVRCMAVRALIALQDNDPRIIPCLCKSLRDSNEDVRFWAASALGNQTGNIEVAIALVKLVGDDNQMVKHIAAQSPGKIGVFNLGIASALLGALCDEDIETRFYAAEALINLDPSASAPFAVLSEVSSSTTVNIEIKRRALLALGKSVDSLGGIKRVRNEWHWLAVSRYQPIRYTKPTT